MSTVFIPLNANNCIEINAFSQEINAFLAAFDVKITNFESKFFTWIELNLKETNDFNILLNWLFWNRYFTDYEAKNLLWKKLFELSEITKEIKSIEENITKITLELKSDKFLTHSRKIEIKEEIIQTTLSLSGLYFIQNKLLEKTIENLKELENLEENDSIEEEFKASASILQEVNKTKIEELNLSLTKLEERLWEYLELISKFIK